MLSRLMFVLVIFAAGNALAVGPEPVLLWPQGAPAAMGAEPKDQPELRFYPADPAKATGACVVILPGGGYGALAYDHEGHQIAVWLNSIGVSGAVVKYRLAPYRHPAPLQDAQRAIRHVRAHAKELGVDPQRVGIMGFSAGGHLASTVSTHFDSGDKDSADEVARQSSRPDFSILCYPVISLQAEYSHKGSRRNLLGDDPSEELVRSLSNETQVTKETPPTFIFHTGADKGVPVENSISYYLALRKHEIPAELHVYQNGPHGVGLAPGDAVLNTWKDRLADWLKVNGILNPKPRAAVSGMIQIDGQPLRWGSVAFIPAEAGAPSAFAMVSQGRYAISATEGPILGDQTVRIVTLGTVVPEPTIPDAADLTSKGQLKVQIAPGNNQLDFNLTGK